LHRCLQRHGINRLPEVEGSKPAKAKFKTYPIGFFHIDIAEVQTAEGKLRLFVAIDRTSKFAFAKLEESANIHTAAAFLKALIEAVPYRVHTVLTDNGIQFCDLPSRRNGPTARLRRHMFDRVCWENGIEHRLTKPYHPWTTDVIDKCFLFRFAIFFFCARVTARQRARCEVRSLPRSFYRRSSFAAPVRAFDAGLEPRGVQPATKWA